MIEGIEPKRYRLHYKLMKGVDASLTGTLRAIKREVSYESESHFNYLNLCYICDDGSEEIVATGYREILNVS